MTYEEVVEKAKAVYAGADAGNVKEHVAIQFNVTGEGEGAFYLEISDGNIDIQPYEYYDRDVLVTASAETLLKITEGSLGLEKAYLTGKIKAEGNLTKALLLKEVKLKKEEDGKAETKEKTGFLKKNK